QRLESTHSKPFPKYPSLHRHDTRLPTWVHDAFSSQVTSSQLRAQGSSTHSQLAETPWVTHSLPSGHSTSSHEVESPSPPSPPRPSEPPVFDEAGGGDGSLPPPQ